MNKETFENKLAAEIESNRKPAKLTLSNVREKLRSLGMQITVIEGEYSVKHVGEPRSKAYFTNDLSDALQTGIRKAEDDKVGARMQTGHLLVEAARHAQRQRSSNLGFSLSGVVVILGEGEIDDKDVLEAMLESTDAEHKDAALRLSKILAEFAARVTAIESDIERARR